MMPKYEQNEIKPYSFCLRGGWTNTSSRARFRPTDTSQSRRRHRRRIPVIDHSILADRIFDSGNYRCIQCSGIHVVAVPRVFESAFAACSPQQHNVVWWELITFYAARVRFSGTGESRGKKYITKYCLRVNNRAQNTVGCWVVFFFFSNNLLD